MFLNFTSWLRVWFWLKVILFIYVDDWPRLWPRLNVNYHLSRISRSDFSQLQVFEEINSTDKNPHKKHTLQSMREAWIPSSFFRFLLPSRSPFSVGVEGTFWWRSMTRWKQCLEPESKVNALVYNHWDHILILIMVGG